MKRRLLTLCLTLFAVLLFGIAAATTPAAAQTDTPFTLLEWVPADFAGALRLETPTVQRALNTINLNFAVASLFQPNRTPGQVVRGLESLFPLTAFDLEGGTFATLINPWLGAEIVVGYPAFDARLNAESPLLMLSTAQPFNAVTAMRTALGGQDLLTTESYRGMTLYVGDRTAFAFTPVAVLIGTPDHLRAALDTAFGDAPALTDDLTYQQVTQALDQSTPRLAGQVRSAPISIYLSGDAAARAPRLLLSATSAADPLFDALVAAVDGLTAYEPDAPQTPERALLAGGIDAIGIALTADQLFTSVRADVVLHTSVPLIDMDADFDPAPLDYLPRSAMFVQSGSLPRIRDGALAALTLANFAGIALSGFPVNISAGARALPAPTGDEVQAAVEALITLAADSGVNARGDLLDQLDGSYAFALIPRPNNPTPLLNTRFDALLIAQVGDDSTYETLDNLARLLLGAGFEQDSLDVRGTIYDGGVIRTGNEPVIRAQIVDNLLIVGTGDSVPLALAAGLGDNRLIRQDRWQTLNQDGVSYLYADLPGMFSVFFPQVDAQTATSIRQVGVTSSQIAPDMLHVRLSAVGVRR
jgi:hypothetical protein